ncbi:MAG: Cof-type HAD-IIB family hydrolase [Erysipelotrichaceae bacterium]|nr:Cof-type HAD-IIB family hydrolase [Erysipelotrichaceae bacterium]
MDIEILELEDGICSVAPKGRIDTQTAGNFSEAMEEACGRSQNIVLDLSDTEYISSTGLRVILSTKKTLGNHGTLTLTGVNETIMEVLDMTGFTDMLDIVQAGVDASDIRVIFFDIDGTLLSHTTGKVPQSAIDAIHAAQANGIKCVIATGRDLTEMSKLPVMDIGFDGYLTLNGNICFDENQEMFAGNEIDPGEVEILVSIFQAGRLPFVLIGEHKRYINYVDDVVIQTQAATHGTIPDIGEYKGEKIYQCLAFVNSEVRKKLEDLLDQCSITSWNDTGIDIIAKTGGKAAGIMKFLEKEGLKRSQVMAFGDGENDIAMIKFAGVGVSMGNGKDALKAAAEYVTTSVDDDGIYNALKHFELI